MNLKQVISSGDVAQIVTFMQKHNLKLEGDKLVPVDSHAQSYCKAQHEYYDRSQLIKKILLNS